MNSEKYNLELNQTNFLVKAKNYAKKAGITVIEPVLKLYYSSQDPDTPIWAKTKIYAALAYFISPIDAITDIIPIIGYSDDVLILTIAIATCTLYIKEAHKQKARATLKQWFD
ncbi:MAG: hypothetical protein RI956_352 [Pseudomonadota bacterium]|jgi:uncharacterized membrane protein YkvA (DUF1232 family)